MNAFSVAKIYFSINLLVLILWFILALTQQLGKRIRFAEQLRLTYALVSATMFIPIWTAIFAPTRFMSPNNQVFTFSRMQLPPISKSLLQFSDRSIVQWTSLDFSLPGKHIAFACFGTTVALLVLSMLLSLQKLQILKTSAIRIRKFRSVRILVSDKITIPFSFWLPLRAYVVVPISIIGDSEKLRIAVAHEIQHHRQHDTKWLYIVAALKILCFWNPGVYALNRLISNLQEFACDEALTGHQSFSPLAYCRCLLWIAESSMQPSRQLIGTIGMTSGSSKNILKRRIEFMLSSQVQHVRRRALLAVGFLTIMAMIGAAVAANASIQYDRISLDQALRMAELARENSDFPLVVNDLVLEQLNHFLGTSSGREYFRQGLAQMENHREPILASLEKFDLPKELLAVPLIESGYRNIPQDSNPYHGAGIWMFIAETAKAFGLIVDLNNDERLNVGLETDAAMRLLSGLNLQFRDWGLALLGYNAGARQVQLGIQKTGSRDVWQLVRNGYENDRSYVAKVIAAVLIMRNPAILD